MLSTLYFSFLKPRYKEFSSLLNTFYKKEEIDEMSKTNINDLKELMDVRFNGQEKLLNLMRADINKLLDLHLKK